jgi:hypothetical protein
MSGPQTTQSKAPPTVNRAFRIYKITRSKYRDPREQ